MINEANNIKNLLGKREESTHKGSYGRVGVIAGSRGMTGAVYLTCQSALRTGSGLVYTIIPESLETIMSIKLTETIIKPIMDENKGHFTKESSNPILEEIRNLDTIALGPGLGLGKDRIQLVGEIIKNSTCPIVIDADGINCIAANIDILKEKKSPIVLTPHPGEMARLLKTDIKDIEVNRVLYAQSLADKFKLVVVLKGHKTLVASPNEETYINNTGNPGMATAGSGDVLTGIIASLLGQGLSAYDSAKIGVYVHGLAGDLVKEKIGEYGIIASDLVEAIPYAMMG